MMNSSRLLTNPISKMGIVDETSWERTVEQSSQEFQRKIFICKFFWLDYLNQFFIHREVEI
jgi:hypothetical protein